MTCKCAQLRLDRPAKVTWTSQCCEDRIAREAICYRVEILAAAQALVGPCHPTHSVGRQGEMENRSVAGLADNADLAPMQFDNRLGNGQPHSSTLYHHALLASAIELLKIISCSS